MPAMSQSCDTVIREASVYDGTGAPPAIASRAVHPEIEGKTSPGLRWRWVARPGRTLRRATGRN